MAWKWRGQRHIWKYDAIFTPFSRRLRHHVVFAKLLYYSSVVRTRLAQARLDLRHAYIMMSCARTPLEYVMSSSPCSHPQYLISSPSITEYLISSP